KQGKKLQWQVNHSLDHYFNYQTRVGLGSGLEVSSGSSRVLFEASYFIAESYLSDHVLLRKVVHAESGLGLGFKVTGRNLYYHFQASPMNYVSYGGVGIRFGRQAAGEEGKQKLGIKIDLSVWNKGYGYNFKYAFGPFEWGKRRMVWIVNHHFHSILKAYIPRSPLVNAHGNHLSFG